tara:strand:+ start:3257 stop:4027 length:771 start_codon:yes stop_codon:yes gene_type:complete
MRVAVFGAAGWLGRAIITNMEVGHDVVAVDLSPSSWGKWDDIDPNWDGELIHGDITDYTHVEEVISSVDSVVHATVYSGSLYDSYGIDDMNPFQINLKGLWNILEVARKKQIRRVVHVGSCQTVHPKGVFFDAEIRRPDGSIYAVTKRLQEEMCRQFFDAFGLSIIVLRPDYIVDSRLGIGKNREKLGSIHGNPLRNGWVCRHDLAEAARLATEANHISFDILHVVGTPEAEKTCNVRRSRELLGLQYSANLQRFH